MKLRKKKVVFVCARFYPDIGGVETHVRAVGKRLVKQGFDVEVMCEREKKNDARPREIDGIHITRWYFGRPGFAKKFRIWARMIINIHTFLHADVIHIHDVFFWYFPLRLLLFFKPAYTTFHGYEGKAPPQKKAVFLRRLSTSLSSKTIEVGDFIHKWYGTTPTKIIYGGVSDAVLEKVDAILTQQKRPPTTPLRFLIIARLTADTAMPQYLSFFEHLKKTKTPFSLTICGDGPFRSALSSYGKVNGFVNNIIPYLEKADVVCASSFLTIIDALACGKKILAFYQNELKKEYLEGFPLSGNLIMTNSITHAYDSIFFSTYSHDTQQSISHQTLHTFSWDGITHIYKDLWKK